MHSGFTGSPDCVLSHALQQQGSEDVRRAMPHKVLDDASTAGRQGVMPPSQTLE